MESLEILKREHRTVLLVVSAARRDISRSLKSGELDPHEIEKLLDFFRYFTNSCHEPKEEDLLFTTLHRRGMDWGAYPLWDLVRQHEEMRVVLDAASDWLPAAKAGDPAACGPLLHDLEAYLDLVEEHIRFEEGTVFPIALQRLKPQDFAELGAAFSAIACEELEEGVHAYYSDLARHLAGAGV